MTYMPQRKSLKIGKADWTARKILAGLAGGTSNMTTNQLTTKIVFGNDRNPQLGGIQNLEELFPGL